MRAADLTPVARDVMKLPAGPGLILASLVGAYLFNSLPWAGWALAARPDMVLVVLVFWVIHQPGSVGQLAGSLQSARPASGGSGHALSTSGSNTQVTG